MLIPVYLRREPTTDRLIREAALPASAKLDVVAYRDAECQVPFARWSWFYRNRPTRAFRRVTLNCFVWRAVWLEDLA